MAFMGCAYMHGKGVKKGQIKQKNYFGMLLAPLPFESLIDYLIRDLRRMDAPTPLLVFHSIGNTIFERT